MAVIDSHLIFLGIDSQESEMRLYFKESGFFSARNPLSTKDSLFFTFLEIDFLESDLPQKIALSLSQESIPKKMKKIFCAVTNANYTEKSKLCSKRYYISVDLHISLPNIIVLHSHIKILILELRVSSKGSVYLEHSLNINIEKM